MRGGRTPHRDKACVLAVFIVLFHPSQGVPEFTKVLPVGLPSLKGWERIVGEAHFDDPHVSVWYEFFVSPERRAIYEVIRYRIRHEAVHRHDDDYPPTERLQWHLAGTKILRRFECQERSVSTAACQWRELPQGGAEYQRETGVILWLYGLHRRLLEERDGGTKER